MTPEHTPLTAPPPHALADWLRGNGCVALPATMVGPGCAAAAAPEV